MPGFSILIVDDEAKLRGLLRRMLELEGYTVFEADHITKAREQLELHPEIALLLIDVKLPDGNGIVFLEKIKEKFPGCEAIMMTAYGTIRDGIKAMQLGAFDYLVKGDDNDKLIPAVGRAGEKIAMRRRIETLENRLEEKYRFENILGASGVIREAIRLAEKVAPTDSTVLLEGETGVGKELFAQAIHTASARKNHAFVAVNCSAFPKDLLESELFGHKKGSFTGATYDKKGLFQEAHAGTLFLDEIGEMSPDLQAKLLRVLETQTFIRIGETKPVKVNVRIIAATNRNLQTESESGHFRPDLYYRLSPFKISIPALRERMQDIDVLAQYFIHYYAAKVRKRIAGMEPVFLNALKQHDWKGNTRELKNVIERAVILCEGRQLTADLLPGGFLDPGMITDSLSLAEAEKKHIRSVLQHTQGNKTKAAELLGIGLTTLYRKIEEYKL
ncbi:MAG: response regulator with CheY-like receiver, AAA-type ATPase, and DNA-binding domain [Bacteroidetes bacterium]|nr:MAG: response regulator with CheY-like receiver, AAA-type ATPase, and DNA-binding domain [Bacteroidota bacterium]